MNKMKKLLSVVLAIIMALSCMTVMASAARANYKSVEQLQGIGAYSPYGEVTRLSTEERVSILFDTLDNILAKANINMGQVVDLLGITIVIDLTSVDGICDTIDSFKSSMSAGAWGLAKGILNLGILEQVSFDTWTSGMSRDGTAQLTIIAELGDVLTENASDISGIISSGKIDLGLVGSLIKGLDLSAVTNLIGDLPGLIKGLIFGFFERWDDTTAEITALENNSKGNGKIIETLNTFVNNLFTNDMSISTVKANASGTIDATKHVLPSSGARVIYSVATVGSDKILTAQSYATQKYVDAQAKLGKTVEHGSYYVTAKYILAPEVGTTDYVWNQLEIEENGTIKTDEETGEYIRIPGTNLKYYELNSPLLPSLCADLKADKVSIDLTTDSAAQLLYKFIPYVFEEMAPVVLNGSMKKILGGLFGAKYNFVGNVGDDEVLALKDSSNSFFTEEQGEYLWEWSNYKVIDGTHYYRFQDQIYVADLSNTNRFFNIIDWGYNIAGTFMNEFVPADGGSTSDTLFMNLNNFLYKVADTVLEDTFFNTLKTAGVTQGDNSKLVNNIKVVAQNILAIEPEAIFGSDYQTNPKCYYSLIADSDNETVLTGIAATVIDLLMPQMLLPTAADLKAQDTTVGALLASALRELATQLIPQNNYDALIYADYTTKKFINPSALLISGETANSYWLDVIMTMGIDIGIEYLHNIVDFYGDTESLSANDTVYHSGYVYAKNTSQADLQAYWESMLYNVVNWALSDGSSGDQLMWSGRILLDLSDSTDPWVLLGEVFAKILPINQILNIDTSKANWLEDTLRNKFILSLVNLEWKNITDLLIVPNGYLRNANVLNQLATLLKNLVNGLFAKVGNSAKNYALIPSAITTFDNLANQANLATLVKGLLGALDYALDATSGGKLLVFVMPIVNYLLGWKTSAQEIAEPQVWTSFRDGKGYAYQWNPNTSADTKSGEAMNATTISFLNNSAGMLETHRGSDVVDKEYAIQIGTITSDATVNNLKFTFSDGNGYVSPYETVSIDVGGTYKGDETVTVKIPYQYYGKDGRAIGGQLYKSITLFISNMNEDSTVDGRWDGDDDKDYTGIDQYKKYQFTKDIYGTITGYRPNIFWVEPTINLGTSSKSFDTICANGEQRNCKGEVTKAGDVPTGTAATYFAHATEATSSWPSKINKNETVSSNIYVAKSGVNENTEFPFGIYDMGNVAVIYGDDAKVWGIDFIYYDDYGIGELYTANKDNGYTVESVNEEDAAVYNEYNAAWKDVVKYATYPMKTTANGSAATVDYVQAIMPKIEPAMERFEAAKKALEEAMADASVSSGIDSALPSYVQELEAQLNLDDGDGEKEINFQDYRLYEYFKYADLRTSARNTLASYTAPEPMDQYYILNSGIREAELNSVIAAEKNAYIAAGITASRQENDEAAIAAQQEIVDAWQPPVLSELVIDDMVYRLDYYKSFLDGSRKVAANKESTTDALVFLNKEISYAEAQNYVEADYTADTWAPYAEALAKAKAVKAGTAEYADCNSTVFAAKFELMKTQKNLLKKADSLIEQGGTAELITLIDQAEVIFANMGNYYAAKDAEKANEAYAALISALGYYYTGEDENEWNLYADSAYEYRDNDRPNRQSNQAKVNAAAKALQDAINLFECTIKVVEKDGGEAIVEQEVKFINGIAPGSILSVADLLNHVKANNADATLATFVSKANVMGTGAGVNLNVAGIGTLATYLVVIYGDVNGDGAIDAFDAIDVDVNEAKEFTGAYAAAADTNGDDMIDDTDYAAIKAAATTSAVLAQSRA